jgi:predicted lipoprotein with Yx(FWY)xxD motif
MRRSAGRDVTVVGRHRRIKIGRRQQLRLQGAGALLLAVSACIHLDLYLTGYRSIPTIGWLFLLQVIVAFVLAAAVLVTHSWLAAAASAGFALSTLGAYLLAVWTGLFGFREIRTRAGIAAGLIEVAAFGVLALAAIVVGPAPQADGPVSRGARMQGRVQAALSMVIGVVALISVAALALLGVAEANAGGPPAVAGGTGVGAGVTVKTATIGGVTVLTNTKGLTLYWFAPDTPAISKCTGSCSAYWPPVAGDPKAGWRSSSDLQRASFVHLYRRQRPRPGERQQPRPQRRPVVRGPRVRVRPARRSAGAKPA